MTTSHAYVNIFFMDPESLGSQIRDQVHNVMDAKKAYSTQMKAWTERVNAESSPYTRYPTVGVKNYSDLADPSRTLAELEPQDPTSTTTPDQRQILDQLEPANLEPNVPVPDIKPAFLGLRRWLLEKRIGRNTKRIRELGDEALSAQTVFVSLDRSVLGKSQWNPPEHALTRRPDVNTKAHRREDRLGRAVGRRHQLQTDIGHAQANDLTRADRISGLKTRLDKRDERITRIADEPLRQLELKQVARQRLLAKRKAFNRH